MLPCRRTRRAGPASFNRAADAWRKKDVTDFSRHGGQGDLSGKRIEKRGAEGLGRALAASSTLAALHLSNCGITAGCAAHLAEGVGRSPSLATLHLSDNIIGAGSADGPRRHSRRLGHG